jgi:FKBP-type peptidyl-prolyl cis-trans isomerase SlyD
MTGKSINTIEMSIQKEQVVAIHYTLRNPEGVVIDTSSGRDPLYYLHGFGNLIPGMEEALESKKVGDAFEVVIAPEKGYGVRDEQLIQQVPKSAFGDNEPAVGMQFQAGNEHGRYVVTVTAVDQDMVTVDANHELAGVQLHFQVEVMEVRPATAEEIAHGHVHGPGGHHH